MSPARAGGSAGRAGESARRAGEKPEPSGAGRPPPPALDDRGVARPGGRAGLQRGVIILPSSLTLGNLFFGVFSMVAAARGDWSWAAWCIVFAALLDMLDGRVARFTRTGSAFGGELDSLVDAISFGVAPGFLLYSLYLQQTEWSWLLSFVYVAAVVVRLARFNVEQLGHAKRHFHGLPSPTAGMILATFYPFSQTDLFLTHLAHFGWPTILGVGVVFVSVLMLSHVPYPVVPRIGFGDARHVVATVLLGLFALAAIAFPRYFIFPLLVLYTLWGFLRTVILGLLERLPERDPLLDEDRDDEVPDESGAELRRLDYGDVAPGRFRSRRDDTARPEDM